VRDLKVLNSFIHETAHRPDHVIHITRQVNIALLALISDSAPALTLPLHCAFYKIFDLEGDIEDSGVHGSIPSIDAEEHSRACAGIRANAWNNILSLETKIRGSHLSCDT
jgi:hypothetical protein